MLAGAPKGSNTAKGMNLMATILQAGFTKGANANMAYAISMAESSGNAGETHVNSDKHKSVDEGLFQLNNYWHPEVDQSRGEMVLDQRSADTVRQALLKANVAGGGKGTGGGNVVFAEGAIKLSYSGPASPTAAKEFGKQVVTAMSDDARMKKIMAGV
jgi:hypothetical protein